MVHGTFFEAFTDPTCLSPHIRNIDIATFDSLIGLYPLILLILFYIAFKLHDRGCTVVVKVWRPFRTCLVCFRRHLDIQSSLISAFFTFSYTKIGIAAFYILVLNRVMTLEGTYTLHVYINPNIKYFHHSHLVYGVIALVLGTAFLILPVVVLCLYPYHCFQRCLNHFRLRSHSNSSKQVPTEPDTKASPWLLSLCSLMYMCVWVIIKWRRWCCQLYTHNFYRILNSPIHM